MTAPAAPARRSPGRALVAFVVLGVLVAAASAGLYVYRNRDTGRTPLAGAPDEVVRQFLYNVFTVRDQDQVAVLVCSSWPPSDAMSRTVSMVGGDARVFWNSLTVATESQGRASVTAQIGTRLPDDSKPTTYHGWRFNLVDEDGWRVCDAEPLIV